MSIVQVKRSTVEKQVSTGIRVLSYQYRFDSSADTTSYPDTAHRLVDYYPIDTLIADITGTAPDARFTPSDYAFERTGWQSWDAGWELFENETVPKFKTFPIPQWKNYIDVPGTITSKDNQLGQFLIYLRWNDTYLVLAATSDHTPPVQYRLNRKERTIATEVYANGKIWTDGELITEITCFIAEGYFQLKDTIHDLFYSNRFDTLSFLGKRPGGWESWYNHYNTIDEKLILEDLESLGKTENLIKLMYSDKGQPVVFQIDDGWQQGTGQWEIRTERFPEGLSPVTDKIRSKGYIPGLWIAPFIFDMRTPFMKEHQDWILRDKKGKPVVAGFNPSWGAAFGKDQPAYPYSYFVLDLSRDDVLEHIDHVITRAINEWGFRYLKLDFLFAGMLNGKFANGGAAYQWYERAVSRITSHTTADNGDHVAFLGCGMPFEASYRYFPLSRIGTDTKEHWDSPDMKFLNWVGRPSAYVSMKDTLGHAFWNNAIFLNDPDVVFFRKDNCSLSDSEKELLAMVNFMFGGQIMHSDDPAKAVSEEEVALTKKILSLYSRFENEEFGTICIESDIYFIFSRSRKYAGVINLSEADYTADTPDICAAAKIENTELSPVCGNAVPLDAADGTIYVVPPHSIFVGALH